MIDVKSLGRNLVVIRFKAPLTSEEAKVADEALGKAFAQCGGQAITFADFRKSGVLPPHIADIVVMMLKRYSQQVARTAFAIGIDHTLLNVQLHRLIREGNNPNRRTFETADAALNWLGEGLTEPQKLTLRKLLAEEGN